MTTNRAMELLYDSEATLRLLDHELDELRGFTAGTSPAHAGAAAMIPLRPLLEDLGSRFARAGHRLAPASLGHRGPAGQAVCRRRAVTSPCSGAKSHTSPNTTPTVVAIDPAMEASSHRATQ